MPVCAFYLRGSCTVDSCPYRHVKVNDKAAVCEEYLRGCCTNGILCPLKHTRICPVFATTGDCPDRFGGAALIHFMRAHSDRSTTCRLKHVAKRKRLGYAHHDDPAPATSLSAVKTPPKYRAISHIPAAINATIPRPALFRAVAQAATSLSSAIPRPNLPRR